MKMKNKICGLIGAIILLTACTEETPIDGQTNISTESLSITFSTEPIPTTKSETESATDDERKVSTCFIGFFELEGDDIPGKMICGDTHLANPDEKRSYIYTIDNIVVPEKEMSKKVRVLVIANPPENNQYKTYADYNDFTDIEGGKGIVAYTNATEFNPSSLIKVGEVDWTFTIKNRTAKVDLRQLAAKVSLEFVLEKTETIDKSFTFGNKTLDEIEAVVKDSGIEGLTYITSCKNTDNQSHYYNGEPYLIGKNKYLWVKLNVDSSEVKISSRWEFIKPSLSINGIVLNSPLIHNETSFEENAVNLENINSQGDKNVVKYTFYTYQVKQHPMTIDIRCGIQNKLETSTKKKSGKMHAVWLNDVDEPQKKWNKGTHFGLADNDPLVMDSEWNESTSTTDGKTLSNLTYKATIYSDTTAEEGILSGCSYKVTGILKAKDIVDAAVNWVVVDIEKVEEINIPSFE